MYIKIPNEIRTPRSWKINLWINLQSGYFPNSLRLVVRGAAIKRPKGYRYPKSMFTNFRGAKIGIGATRP